MWQAVNVAKCLVDTFFEEVEIWRHSRAIICVKLSALWFKYYNWWSYFFMDVLKLRRKDLLFSTYIQSAQAACFLCRHFTAYFLKPFVPILACFVVGWCPQYICLNIRCTPTLDLNSANHSMHCTFTCGISIVLRSLVTFISLVCCFANSCAQEEHIDLQLAQTMSSP
jgi:hypothetical protein